jgi:predicted  nucleic acid-binding Zn-ribbon protein
MEKAESDAREIATATAAANEARKTVDARVADLNAGEAGLQKELAGLQSNRGDLAAAVEEGTLSRYERLLKQKGQNVVVGIQHGVCGGCHMQLSRSVIVLCQGEQEVVTCPNCARILYYTRDMDMAVAD